MPRSASPSEPRSEGFVILTLEFKKEGRHWLGRCRELRTSTFAGTLDAVRRELVELVTLHLNELEAVGERERFFKEHGVRLYRAEPRKVRRTLQVAVDTGVILAQALPVHVPQREPVTA